MGQRRGGGNGDGDFTLRRGLEELLAKFAHAEAGGGRGGGGREGSRGRDASRRGASGAGAAAGGGGGGGSGRGGSRGASAASARPPQPGDWTCRCGFQPNFARRRTCYSCGKPRPAVGGQAKGGAGSLSGPIGADGLRPLLGGRGGTPAGGTAVAQRPPSFRVPGVSVAARAQAATAATATPAPAAASRDTVAAAADGLGEATGVRTRRGVEVDEDGFQTVQRRWRPNGAAAADGAGGGGGGGESCTGTFVAHGDGAGADAAEAEVVEDEAAPDPSDLRRAWQTEIALVKGLARQGLQPEHPAMRAAVQARDEAEDRWRAAKDPTPISLRLSRAQAKVDAAVNRQAEARAALLDLEKEFADRKKELVAKLEEARDRVRERRQQLEAVQVEAGADAPQRRPDNGGAIRQVHGALANEVAPTIAALVEHLDTGSQAWSALNGVLSTLATSQQLLQGAIGPAQTAQSFDIGDCNDDAGGEDGAMSQCGSAEWSESHELAEDGIGGGGYEGGQGGWGSRSVRQNDPAGDQNMGSGSWWDGPGWQATARWMEDGHGKWSKASWADSWEDEYAAGDQGGPAAKHRRQDEHVATAQGPADHAAAAAQAKQQHDARVAAIVQHAIDAGVQPLTAMGEELHLLDPHQLDAWVEENMPSLPPVA